MTPAGATLHRLVRRREVGVVLALLGAVLIVAGVLRTTAGKPDSSDCPDGTTLVAKFNYVGGSYVFEKPAGNGTVVTITDGTATGGSWSATQAISAVVVKGGRNAVVTSYNPAVMSGSFSNAGLPPVGSGNTPDVSHVEFCGGGSETTTTTAEATTSTTSAASTTTTTPTSTTVPTGPTTTAPVTTTTVASAATTTVPQQTTTTTAPTATTTTVASATTTEPDSSTTTVASAATTTTPEGEPSTSTTLSVGATTSTTGGPAGFAVATSTTIVPVRGEPDADLPRTGAPSLPLIGIGLLLVTSGAALAIVNGRRDRARAPRST